MYELQKGTPENIKEKITILFLQHVMQRAVNLEEEKERDNRYCDYKIRCFPRRVEAKFLKYGRLHPMSLGQEEDRYEEVWGDGGLIFG